MSIETRPMSPHDETMTGETGCDPSCFGRDSAPGSADGNRTTECTQPGGLPSSSEAEPCPSPLSWIDVVERLRTESQSWDVDRGTYSITGRTVGSGPPLYFLGGATGSSELFALMVWLLKDEFRCVIYDYPDHVARNSSGRPLTIDDYADDLAAIIDAHDDEQVSAYAVSLGVPVLLTAMHRYPRHIARGVVQGGQLRLPLTILERLALACCRLRPGKLRHLPGRDIVWRANHRAWFPPFDFSRWNFFAEVTGDVSLRTLAHRLSLMHHTDLAPILGEVTQPVLVVGTEGEGPRLSARRKLLEQAIPQTQTELLDTTGLVPFLTHPHRLKKIITPFLTVSRD